MSEIDPKQSWGYMKCGQWQNAIVALTRSLEIHPSFMQVPLFNRGICYLALHELEMARCDFEEAHRLFPKSCGYAAFVGIVDWWLGKPERAFQAWKEALVATYVDEAGGVLAPALLYFVSRRFPTLCSQSAGIQLLRDKWNPSMSKLWPGPILAFSVRRDGCKYVLN